MAFVYDAGTTTPYLAGLVEFNGIRINDGSFKLTDLGELKNSPPVRLAVSPFSSDSGGYIGPPFYDPLTFTLTGYLDCSAVSDLDAAWDKLCGAFNLANTSAQALVFNRTGYPTRRQVTAIVTGAGPMQEEPVDLEKAVPQRNFSIALAAADPLKYDADNLRTVTVPMTGASTAVTNAGTVPVPFVARLTGPFTTSMTLTHVESGLVLNYGNGVIAGAYVDVQTNPVLGLTAVSNAGVNEYFNIGPTWSVFTIPPGTSHFTATGAGGTTGASQVVLTWRDGWA